MQSKTAQPHTLSKAKKSGRKYDSYMSIIDAIEGVNRGTLQRGILRVNRKRLDDAYVTANTDAANPVECLIRGRKDRNRAIHGDMVVYQIIDRPTETPPLDAEDASLEPKPETVVELEEAVDEEEEIESVPYSKSKLPIAKVVYVEGVSENNRLFVSNLCRNSSHTSDSDAILEVDRTIKAVPVDKRIPWIIITMKSVESSGYKASDLNASDFYLVQLVAWNEFTALPRGEIVSYIGPRGDLKAEALNCMISHSLDGHLDSFSEESINEAKAIVEFTNRTFDVEAKRRIDLRDKLIFTIDPSTAKDFDDAIHITQITDSYKTVFEIGVHIADVSYFVRLDSTIDNEARARCTSVYLPCKSYPMLPTELCCGLCSLSPNDNKFAFSVIFRIDSDGNLDERFIPQFFKSVIRSACQLSYENAQHLIDTDQSEEFGSVKLYGNFTKNQLTSDLRLLYRITQKMRENRFLNGSLFLRDFRLKFSFKGPDIIDSAFIETHSGAHELIEEIMLMCNYLVARQLRNSALCEKAVFRCHPPPLTRLLLPIEDLLRKVEIESDFATAASMQRTLHKISSSYGSVLASAIELLLRKPMSSAIYTVFGMHPDTHHYALNFTYYTHFTSPIRRYADVMVHRLLFEEISNKDASFRMDESPNQLNLTFFDAYRQCKLCNAKSMEARAASLDCEWAYFCSYLKTLDRPIISVGVPISISGSTVEMSLPYLGKVVKLQLSIDNCYTAPLTQATMDRLKFPRRLVKVDSFQAKIDWSKTDVHDEKSAVLTILSCIPVFVLASVISLLDIFVCIIPPKDLLFQKTAGSVDAYIIGEIVAKSFPLPPKYNSKLKN